LRLLFPRRALSKRGYQEFQKNLFGKSTLRGKILPEWITQKGEENLQTKRFSLPSKGKEN